MEQTELFQVEENGPSYQSCLIDQLKIKPKHSLRPERIRLSNSLDTGTQLYKMQQFHTRNCFPACSLEGEEE